MTEKKKLKKRVRARMAETGEMYTQAPSEIRQSNPLTDETEEPEKPRIFKRKFPTFSGWLGTIAKEKYIKQYEGLPPDSDAQDPDFPIRFLNKDETAGPLVKDEDFERLIDLWETAPDVSKEFSLLTRTPRGFEVVKILDREIDRLRQKLIEAGIDPDK